MTDPATASSPAAFTDCHASRIVTTPTGLPMPDETNQLPDVMSMKEVAQRLNTDVWTARDLARRNLLPVPTLKVGKRVYISRRAFDAKMAEQHPDTSAA